MSKKPIFVTLRLNASDGAEFQTFLAQILPQTRRAQGCRYNKSYVSRDNPNELLLIQEWDSLEDQQAYMKWRESTGVLDQFKGFLAKPPELDFWELGKA